MHLDQKRLKAVLIYNPGTGLFFWKRRSDVPSIWNRKCAKKLAGHKTKNGRVTIAVDARAYYAHRLAWLYMTGKWPHHLIDHKDGDALNNKWTNLRDATRSQNNANKKINRDSQTQIKGVRLRSSGRYQARISNIHLGMFDSAADAALAFRKAAHDRFGEFARTK